MRTAGEWRAHWRRVRNGLTAPANPMGAYAICRRCHRLLHLRFHDPDTWTAHAALHARGGVWFERLSLDPASKTRPFAETYPEGLPGAFEP